MLAMAAVYSALASFNVVAKIMRPLRRGGEYRT